MKPNVTKKNHHWIIENSKQRVLQVLFRFPDTEFSLSDLAKEARVAKPHIGTILTELSTRDFIKIKKLSKIWRIRANLASESFVRSKMIYNLFILLESDIIGDLDIYYEHPKSIVLFGSYRKGEDITGSDIDIAIEVEKEIDSISLSLAQQMKLDKLVDKVKAVEKFEKLANRQVQILLFNRNTVDLHVFNNIANGIVLAGFLEVKL